MAQLEAAQGVLNAFLVALGNGRLFSCLGDGFVKGSLPFHHVPDEVCIFAICGDELFLQALCCLDLQMEYAVSHKSPTEW